jgi:alpha-tubulin suppressor-like RCC1 family protein
VANQQVAPYFFARQTNGTLWSWGDNYTYGQLGLGDTINRITPTQVGTSSDWSTVACGSFFTVAIKTNGTIWSCGFNLFGQLGQGANDITAHPTFTQIGGGTSDWFMAAAGEAHSIALKTNGTIWTWGCNIQGQLGRSGDMLSPVPVGTDSDWSLITAGKQHTAAIKTNGTIWVWGNNSNGQLGLGDTINRPTPTQESTSASDWSAVAGGSFYTIALKTNGSLWAWGQGYGANPSRIGSDTDWSIIKTGGLTIARKTNGTVWAWTYYYQPPTLVGE